MRMRYEVKVPPTAEQGSYKTIVRSGHIYQTYRQEALQDYNSARAHDGLPPLKRMPAGTTYTPLNRQHLMDVIFPAEIERLKQQEGQVAK